LLSRICVGSIGRKERNRDAPAAENMFPKFDEVPMSTYLIVLAKIRRPSTTPSARMPRSLSRRTTAAASLATSAAESTEIPTSAWWSAIASLTPSPRKAVGARRDRRDPGRLELLVCSLDRLDAPRSRSFDAQRWFEGTFVQASAVS
jgi:hypothetical protein